MQYFFTLSRGDLHNQQDTSEKQFDFQDSVIQDVAVFTFFGLLGIGEAR